MVFDFHYHLYDRTYFSEEYLDFIANTCVNVAPPERPISFEETRCQMLPKMFDPTGEVTVRYLDEWGIDKAALLVMDVAMLYGEGEISIEGFNKAAADAAKRFPDRLIPFFGIDPRRPNTLELVDRCINDFEMKGLKCHPDTGWYPDDEAYLPFWNKIQENSIPVLTHTGPMDPPSVSECVHPDRLDKLALNFPDMTIIAAHMGNAWYKELIAVAKKRPNIMTDISGWQVVAHQSYGKFVHILRKVIDAFGPDRVLFATDAPSFSFLHSEKEWVETIRDLPHKAPEGYTFTEEEIESILYGNAARILGL